MSLKRIEPILRVLCVLLGVAAIYYLAILFRPSHPLSNIKVPIIQVVKGASKTEPAPKPKSGSPPAPRMPGHPPGGRGTEVPPAIQEKVDRITQSEILAPVMRPLPMALLGIGGKDAIIRTPMGQTSLMREGDENGGVKLLKIGTNRVLIEHEGKKKELIIFSGFGSQTLVEKENTK